MIDVNSLSSEQQKGIKYIDLPSSIALFLDNKYLGSTSVPKEGGKVDMAAYVTRYLDPLGPKAKS